MMRVVFIGAFLALGAPVAAQSMASMTLATDLGNILASEEICDLTYDQAAISAFIESKVPADDMSFPSMLQTMTMGQEYTLKDMSASGRTAHCTQISRVAKSYGFIE